MPYLSTVAAFGFADFNPPTLLPIYRDLGCRACQFYRNTDNPPAAKDARVIAEDAGLPIDSIHGVFGQDLDPSSPDASVRTRTMDVYKQEGGLALELGGPAVVVHPAPHVPEGRTISDDERAARAQALRQSMQDFAAFGDELGVTYLIENITPSHCFGHDAPGLARMIREIDHPRVRMCFDTGHANVSGGILSMFPPCADMVTYLHINDNLGDRDSHLIPGDGSVPWNDLREHMAALPDNVSAMLELFFSEDEMKQRLAAGLGETLRHWLATK